MEYFVRTVDTVDFSVAEKAYISNYKWTEGYAPEAYAQLLYVKNKGFALKMTVAEESPRAVYNNYDDPVYTDSCLEFFVRFNKDMPEYMNFEMNSNGAFLAARRTSRHNKEPIHTLAELPVVTASKGNGSWSVETFFDLAFIKTLFGKDSFVSGDHFFGNFYKCGDDTDIPHFGMWSPVDNPTPDFHRPEFFGKFIIA